MRHTLSWTRRALKVAFFLLVAGALPAQAPTAAQLDSLVMRLEDAEAALDVLRQQLGETAGANVRTRSRLSLELHGRVLMNVFMNSKETMNVDVPMYGREGPAGSPEGGLGFSIRQTMLGLSVTHPEVWGGRFTGDLDVDFFGGQFNTSGGRTFPLIRLRTARAIVDWDHSQLLIGQEQPLISNLNPVSLAAVGVPEFSYAGNLWLWLPQIRYGWHTTGALRVGAQAALLAPTSSDTVGVFYTTFDKAERTKMPFAQGRLSLAWGEPGAGGEIGIGYHAGQVMDSTQAKHPSHAIAADWYLPTGTRLDLRGEFYAGQLVRGLGSGAVGQNFGVGDTVPVRTMGAWLQVNSHVSSTVRFGAGLGFDDPEDEDVDPVWGYKRNDITSVYLHWRPTGPLVLGLEWRAMRTQYATWRYSNTHLNFAMGFEF